MTTPRYLRILKTATHNSKQLDLNTFEENFIEQIFVNFKSGEAE